MFGSASDSVSVTVTELPSVTGFGETDRLSVGTVTSSSVIPTVTEVVLPAVTPCGSAPRATVKVSWSVSSSWFVVIVPVTVVRPRRVRSRLPKPDV